MNISKDLKRFKRNPKAGFFAFLVSLMDQGFLAVANFRLNSFLVSKKIPIIHIIPQKLVEWLTGISIPPSVKIGAGFVIEHFGGIVINSKTIIGDNCTITHGVTIGNGMPGGKPPVIGNDVYICVGAKILGDIEIGDGSIIGADAVVLSNIPPNSIVAGNPAKIIKSTQKGDKYDAFFTSRNV